MCDGFTNTYGAGHYLVKTRAFREAKNPEGLIFFEIFQILPGPQARCAAPECEALVFYTKKKRAV
jgi:hypothetical protein